MQSPVCFVDETGNDVRNRPMKIVKEGTYESPRSELAIADSTECTDERSQISMSSTEIADKEFGPVWGETGEVSPPRSRSSADIPLGQRLGEISPDRSSNGSASMETSNLTVNSRLPRPLVFESEEKELNGSSAVTLSSTCRPFSKEHPSISPAYNRGQEDVTYEQQRKENILMQAHSQNMAMSGYSTPRAKLEHSHELLPEMDLERCDAPIVYMENLSNSRSFNHPQQSKDQGNAQLVSLSTLEEGEISAINSNSSEAMSESNLTVPSGSLHSVPSLLYPAGFAEQTYQPGSQEAVNSKKMEDVICSWENFLSEVKSYGQMPPDFVKSLEVSLAKTKGELKFDTKELAVGCYSRISTDGDDKECMTSTERVADPGKTAWKQSLGKRECSLLQSHEHCWKALDFVCDHEEGTFPDSEDRKAWYQERTADELSEQEEKSLVNIVNDCEKLENQVNSIRKVRKRPSRRIEHSSELESPLKVNPNKRNTNIPLNYVPWESKQSTTPNPGTVSPKMVADFGEEQNYGKVICKKGDANFRGVTNQKKNVPIPPGEGLQPRDTRNSDKFSNQKLEATARTRVSHPQFQHCSSKFFSSGDSKAAKRGSINLVSDESKGAIRANINSRNPESIIINPNRNKFKPSINKEVSSYKEQSRPKLQDTGDRLVALKPSSRSSAKSLSKESMNRKVKPKSRLKVSVEHQGKVIENNNFFSNFDLPNITPKYSSDQTLINPISQNSNLVNISRERKEQIWKQHRQSRLQEYQAVYGRSPPYLGRASQRQLPVPYQHQLIVPNYTYHRDLNPYCTMSPGFYGNNLGQSQMSLGHLEVYPKSFYPAHPLACPCHTPLLYYH